MSIDKTGEGKTPEHVEKGSRLIRDAKPDPGPPPQQSGSSVNIPIPTSDDKETGA
jgi:hypothetical protein